MKRFMLVTAAIMIVLLGGNLFAQTGNFTFGLVTSQFLNSNDNDNRLSKIDNPLGFGLMLGYQINEQAGIGFTGEYFSGDLENKLGSEKDFRGNLSFFVFPLKWQKASFYLSSGVVFMNQEIDYENLPDEDELQMNMRSGLGLDYLIIPGLHLNVDFGVYSDGLNYVGSGSTIGFRYAL